ncbi:hypothetical protein KAR91_45060 [Candidatus Pacearchaeota archaeon]|nr:hypothetical protein [Candidatus Pacearchaeota archaeon]
MELMYKDPKIKFLGMSTELADPNGCLLMFEGPKKGREYYLGCDIGGGLGLSNSVIHVLKKGTKKDYEMQVAEFACNFLKPNEFAAVIQKIGFMYFDHYLDMPAVVNVESNNYGEHTIHTLSEEFQYENLFQDINTTSIRRNEIPAFGTRVTAKTRTKLVMLGETRLKTGHWIINSPYFINEMAGFEIAKIKDYDALAQDIKAAAGRFQGKKLDDRLFAGFHALWAANAYDPDLALDRERYLSGLLADKVRKEDDEDYVKPTYRNTAISYDRMMRELDEF